MLITPRICMCVNVWSILWKCARTRLFIYYTGLLFMFCGFPSCGLFPLNSTPCMCNAFIILIYMLLKLKLDSDLNGAQLLLRLFNIQYKNIYPEGSVCDVFFCLMWILIYTRNDQMLHIPKFWSFVHLVSN